MIRAKIGSRLYNVNEAIRLGEIALQTLTQVKADLNSAMGWGVLDIIKGKVFTTMIKRSSLKKARKNAEKADLAIRKFNDVMVDLNEDLSVGYKYKKTFVLADYIDNKFFDTIVEAQIMSNRKRCDEAIKELKKQLYYLQKEKRKLVKEEY